jgi:hypothetical protein
VRAADEQRGQPAASLSEAAGATRGRCVLGAAPPDTSAPRALPRSVLDTTRGAMASWRGFVAGCYDSAS